MSHRPYPNVDRARRYATLHGKPMVVIDLAPLLASADFSGEEERMRTIVDALPSGTIQFSSWFPSLPRPDEEPTR